MSTKTFLKRAALLAAVSLGLGILSVPTSQATSISPSLTLSSATATATVGDTATGSWTLRYTAEGTQATAANADTAIVTVGCEAPTGQTCPSVLGRQTISSDTFGVVINSRSGTWANAGMDSATWLDVTANYWGESATTGTNISVRSAVAFKATAFPKAGTYTYTFIMKSNQVSAGVTTFSTVATATWTVTVTAPSIKVASISNYYFAANDNQAQEWRGGGTANTGVANSTSRDSAIVTSAGTAASPTAVGFLYMIGANTAGDTRTALGSGFSYVHDTVTVSITGPGLLASDGGAGVTKAKSVSAQVSSRALSAIRCAVDASSVCSIGESVTVYSDGTAGVGTITVTNAGGTLLTRTITFTGAAASATPYLNDTYTYYGVGSVNLIAEVKDSGGNRLQSGTLYVFSSDTNVVSAGATLYSNAATQYQTSGRCGNTSGQWSTTTNKVTCALTIGDSGTASIYLADSWNVTASSFVTTAITLTVSESKPNTVTVAFDKATYAPGEAAIITITGADKDGRNIASNGLTGMTNVFSKVTSSPELSYSSMSKGTGGTTGTNVVGTSFITLNDGAVETRVVVMPSYGTDVTYSVTYTKVGAAGVQTTASATAKVVDPVQDAQNAAIAAAQKAAVAAAEAATAAADAATDAALQAIDAANAATDAANLGAEAADAATVAAEEAKDAADAATAAVEALATQVATLMAALQAQVRSLANTVAKIAKKVKA